jgi:hypothetical protein
MKKWQIAMVTVMALLLTVLSPMQILAQSDEVEEGAAGPKIKGALAIVAPRLAFVGQEISMTTFLRVNQEPFPGAGVWALTQEEADILRAEMEALREEGDNIVMETDFEALVSIRGEFLGRTGEDGKLYHTFNESGRYHLVAAKKGYLPGFTGMNVRETPRALGVEAPKQAKPAEEITISAFQRVSEEPVEGAGIWALTRDKVEVLREELQALREDTSVTDEEKDYEAVVNVHGFFLGNTNEGGELNYAFEEAGGYLLVAVKRGYHPGFAPIGIRSIPNALALRVPWMVPEGNDVTMAVVDRINQEAVEGAGIWALTRDKMEVLREEMTSLREDTSIAAEEKDYESLVGVHGSFLGRTNENGELNHNFDQAGAYLLVTVKRGYIPGFAPIFVRGAPERPVPEPRIAPEPRVAPEPEANPVPEEEEQAPEGEALIPEEETPAPEEEQLPEDEEQVPEDEEEQVAEEEESAE